MAELPREQVQSKDFRQIAASITGVRHGQDTLVVALAHDELTSAQPMPGRLLDIEVVLSPIAAKGLADALYSHLASMGNITVEK